MTDTQWDAQRRRPPARGLKAHPATERIAVDTKLWRIHRRDRSGDEFSSAIPGAYRGGRFDCEDAAYGVLYAADRFEGAVAETILRDTPLADAGSRVVPFARVRGRAVSALETTRELRLASLHGAGLAAIGQGLWLTKCDAVDYPLTRAWARAIHDAWPDVDGLVWRARFDEDQLVVVLFGDRCADALQAKATVAIETDEGLEAVRRVLLDHSAVVE